jgi:hypothetical protein
LTLPHEFFSHDLTDGELRVLVALYHLADANGVVTATMEELTILTRLGREAMRRAMRKLEEREILLTTRTKRNLGKLSKNRYKVLVTEPVKQVYDPLRAGNSWGVLGEVPVENAPEGGMVSTDNASAERHGESGALSLSREASTASSPVDKSTELPGLTSYIANKQVSVALGTSFLKGRADGAPKIETEERDMNRWSADDDFVGGVGLFEEEVAPSGKPKPKPNKRSASTRGQRPESEWTANDVAAEFAYQLGRRFPRLPGLVNVAAVRGALMRYRGQIETTPEVEMEIMRMYFEDEYNLKLAQENPSRAHGKYLAMFKTHIGKAHERLGLDYFESRVVIDPTDDIAVLFSSDGREFEDNMSGRAALKAYEAQLLARLATASTN